jgi:hypothetical protein
MDDTGEKNEALRGIDDSKRRTLIRLGLGVAFVTPIVASFSMDGLTISKVHAQNARGSGFTNCSNETEPFCPPPMQSPS